MFYIVEQCKIKKQCIELKIENMEIIKIKTDEALQKLIEGNDRFINGSSIHPNQTQESRINNVENGQHPIAVILSCSDSRVPPEIIFDQGIGDLFVIRVAGNILDDIVLASIEFAIKKLGIELLLILGHEHCEAVRAATQDAAHASYTQSIVNKIKPAVKQAQNQQGDLLYNSILNNIQLVAEEILASSPVLVDSVKEDKVKIVGAYYHMESGKVEIKNVKYVFPQENSTFSSNFQE